MPVHLHSSIQNIMLINESNYSAIVKKLNEKNITLIAVSKTKSDKAIRELHDRGQNDFGENYVQELMEKQQRLPHNIRWHFIGHLQSNKVKYIAPFVYLIQSVDSLKLLKEINKQAEKNNRVINVLLQIHIAEEETKFGLDEKELEQLFNGSMDQLLYVKICGLMGMASLSNDENKIRKEFSYLKALFNKYAQLEIANCQLQILSMGMSSDYTIAVEEGSTMVRIGSLIFGEREYS